jgi:hypothetical protein
MGFHSTLFLGHMWWGSEIDRLPCVTSMVWWWQYGNSHVQGIGRWNFKRHCASQCGWGSSMIFSQVAQMWQTKLGNWNRPYGWDQDKHSSICMAYVWTLNRTNSISVSALWASDNWRPSRCLFPPIPPLLRCTNGRTPYSNLVSGSWSF